MKELPRLRKLKGEILLNVKSCKKWIQSNENNFLFTQDQKCFLTRMSSDCDHFLQKVKGATRLSGLLQSDFFYNAKKILGLFNKKKNSATFGTIEFKGKTFNEDESVLHSLQDHWLGVCKKYGLPSFASYRILCQRAYIEKKQILSRDLSEEEIRALELLAVRLLFQK